MGFQEHQARELVCSHYPTYTSRLEATSATTNNYHTWNQSALVLQLLGVALTTSEIEHSRSKRKEIRWS